MGSLVSGPKIDQFVKGSYTESVFQNAVLILENLFLVSSLPYHVLILSLIFPLCLPYVLLMISLCFP